MMFNLIHYKIGILLTVVTTLAMSLFVFIRAWKQKLVRSYGLFTTMIFGWSFIWFLMVDSMGLYDVLFYSRATHIPAAFIPSTFFYFVQCLVEKDSDILGVRLRRFFYLSAIAFAGISFHPMFVSSIEAGRAGFPYFLVPGPLYHFFVVWFAIGTITSFVILVKNFKISGREKRNQLAYVFFAYLLAFGGGSLVFLPCYNIRLPTLSLYAVVIAHAVFFYAIITQRLLNINIFLRRASLLIIIYAAILAAIIPILYILHNNTIHIVGFDYKLFYTDVFILSGVLSMGPFIYAYLVRKSFWLRSHLTQGLTHELKSPLGNIRGAVDVLLEEMAEGKVPKNKVVDYLKMIQANSERMDVYVRDLLTIARSQEENVTLIKAPVHLTELLHECIQQVEPAARQKNIGLQFAPGSDVEVFADEAKIRQVISNLLSNAIKFSDGGTITVELKKSDREIICSVQDEGRGIDPKHLSKIFDRFYQATPNTKGSGIGLAIAKAWVEAHGGKIWAESAGLGKGSRFVFTIPTEA